MNPLFLKDKTAEKTLTQAAAQGSQTLYLDNSDAQYSVDDLLLIGNSEGKEVEFLGTITEAYGDHVKVQRTLKQARQIGDKTFKPAELLQWEVERSSPLLRRLSSGAECKRSIGGIWYATRIAEPGQLEIVYFERITREMFLEFQSWWEATLTYGLEAFTLVNESAEVVTVRLVDSELEHLEEYPRLATLKLEVAILNEEEYV